MGPPPGSTRETRIRRDRHGRWFDGDEPVTNPAIASAFDRWIDRAPDGRYCLSNSVNWAYVSIEGAPIFVRAAQLSSEGVMLELSDERTELLDPSTLATDQEGRLFCTVRQGRLQAEFTSSAMMHLDPILDEDAEGDFLTIGGARFRIQK
jgi:uncharacterized protein